MKKKTPICPTTDNSLCFKILSVAIILVLLPSVFLTAAAQTSAWELPGYKERVKGLVVGVGSTTARETYVSESTYSGPSVTIQEDTWKGYSPLSVLNYGRTHTSVMFGSYTNSLGGGRMMYFNFDYFYSRAWNAIHTNTSDLLLGPSVMLKLGCVYDGSGSNNPATAEGYLSAGLCVDYTYRFSIKNRPLALQVSLFSPLMGISPAPDYDQPYWFVYKYNQYDKLIHFAWVGNCFALKEQISLLYPLRAGSLKVGCSLDYLGNTLGGHYRRILDWDFTVGWVYKLRLKEMNR